MPATWRPDPVTRSVLGALDKSKAAAAKEPEATKAPKKEAAPKKK